jgi:hypothetical protein
LFDLVFYIGLLYLIYPKPNMGGENAIGYGLGLGVLGLGLTISSIAMFVALAQHGIFGFGVSRLFLEKCTGCYLLSRTFIFTVFFSAVFKWESHPEMITYVQGLSRINSLVWFPVLVFIPAFLVLFQIKEPDFVPVRVFFHSGLLSVFFFSAGLLVEWINFQIKDQKAKISYSQTRDREQFENYMNEIEELDSTQSILGILPLTGRFHEAEVREAAVARIKSRADWENELIGILVSEYNYHYAYDFLDGNNVDNPELFTEPVRLSILQMAADIRTAIPNADNLQEWSFDHFGIERLLRVVDGQLAGQNMDFYPAILEVRKALDTTPPERFKGVKYSVTPVLDKWLKDNRR